MTEKLSRFLKQLIQAL